MKKEDIINWLREYRGDAYIAYYPYAGENIYEVMKLPSLDVIESMLVGFSNKMWFNATIDLNGDLILGDRNTQIEDDNVSYYIP